MEENKNINENEDLKDFGDELDFVAPNLDELGKNIEENEEDIVVPDFEDETQSLETTEKAPENENAETQENTETETEDKETPQEKELRELKEKYEENSKKLDSWEELNSTYDIVKKYIVYVDKENIEAIDNLSVDERNAFINSAIKTKFENNDIEKVRNKRAKILLHSTIMLCTAIMFMPIAVYLAHLSIVATFKNYKYSQDSFEKLYKESFSKSPTYKKASRYSGVNKKR